MFRFVLLVGFALAVNASIAPRQPSLTPDGRIVGGSPIPISEAPWSASLLLTASNLFHTCGGSIISPTVILTAGHCLYGRRPKDIKVRVGSATNNAGGQLIDPTKFVMHEKYNNNNLFNDIALIILAEPVTIASASKVKLPEQDEEVEDDAVAVNTGWGRLSEGGSSPTALQSVKVSIINQETCKTKNSFVNTVLPTMICAGVPQGGKGACNGDSGGPLMVGDSLVGLTSWSSGCVRPGYPTVYTRVASFIDWIETNME